MMQEHSLDEWAVLHKERPYTGIYVVMVTGVTYMTVAITTFI